MDSGIVDKVEREGIGSIMGFQMKDVGTLDKEEIEKEIRTVYGEMRDHEKGRDPPLWDQDYLGSRRKRYGELLGALMDLETKEEADG